MLSMRTKIFTLAFSSILAVAPAFAQSSVEVLNRMNFSTCEVYDRIDMFTDRTSHYLQCPEPSGSTYYDANIYFVVYDDGGFSVFVTYGAQDVGPENTIPVTIRVDRGTVLAGDWGIVEGAWTGGITWARKDWDADLFTTLLTEIANGERIAIRVKNSTGTIPLTAEDGTGAYGAVEEFLARIAHIKLVVQ